MAENIDELQIEIKVNDNNSAKQIGTITSAVKDLTEALSGLNEFSDVLDKLSKIKVPDVTKNIGKTVGNIPTPKMEDIEVESILNGSEKKLATDGTNNFNEILSKNITLVTEDEYAVERLKLAVGQLDGTFNLSGESAKEAAQAFGYTAEELDAMEKPAKKATSALSKFAKSVGRIAMYRAIRSVLKGITSGAKEGLENLRSQNQALDQSLNKLSLAGTSLKNSFGAMLAPIIQSIEPLITRISDGIARIVNRFSEAQAKMKGQSQYTKILTSDMEEYQKQLDKTNGSLLEFDTFTTLASQDSYTGTTQADVTMSEEEAESLSSRLETIKNLVEAIGVALGGWAIVSLVKDLSKMSGLLGSVGKGVGIAAVIFSIFEIINNIKDLVENWNIMSQAQKIKKIMQIVFLGLAGIFTALSFVPALQLWAIPAAIAAWVGWGTVSSIPAYATGGDFQTADLFYANENGQTELIASSNSGGGAVMNMEQLQTAIYNGMMMAMSDSGDKEITLKVDQNTLGRVVAQSSGFINETNRRNTGLRLI